MKHSSPSSICLVWGGLEEALLAVGAPLHHGSASGGSSGHRLLVPLQAAVASREGAKPSAPWAWLVGG
jgi:hypothetical protein